MTTDLPQDLIPASTLFIATTGIYDDYSVIGVFRTKSDLHLPPLISNFIQLHPDQENYFDSRDFISWLVSKQELEHIPTLELSLGAYGRLEWDISSSD